MYLFTAVDFPLSENYDATLSIDFHDLRHTIRITRMVDVSCKTTR